jgi:glycine cleavage system H lipoate-binding protein
MLIHSKKTGNITFMDGKSTKVLKGGAFLEVESQKAADSLMRMYPGLIVEVKAETEAQAEAVNNEPLIEAAPPETEMEVEQEIEPKSGSKKNASKRK